MKLAKKRPRMVLPALLFLVMAFCLLPGKARAAGTITVDDGASTEAPVGQYVLASTLGLGSGDTLDIPTLCGDSGVWVFVIDQNVTFSQRLTIVSDTNHYVVFKDGATLTAEKGIVLTGDMSIFVEVGASGSGGLRVTNPDSDEAGLDIGSSCSMNIYGGTFSVVGGSNAPGVQMPYGVLQFGTSGASPLTATITGNGSGAGIDGTDGVVYYERGDVRIKGGTTGKAINCSTHSGFTDAQANAVNTTIVPGNFTVTFNSDGGSTVAAQTIDGGLSATQPAAPTKDGYTFNGWTLNGSAYNFSTAVTDNITLTATWTTNAGGNSNPVTPATGSTAVKAGGAQVDAASGISNAAKTAAASAINAALSNARTTTVNGTDFDASQIGVVGASVSVSIRTTLNGYSLTAGNGDSAVVNKLVYDITPYASVNGGAESAVSNNAIRSGARITVYLPIPSNFPWNYADVVHKSTGRSDETYSGLTVQGSGNSRYVAVTVSHFSEFNVTPGSSSGSGSGGGTLPHTGMEDFRAVYLCGFALSALCAAAFRKRKRFQ